MNQNEKELFMALCRVEDERFDATLLEYASPSVLGQLFFNRMQGVAYGTLQKHGVLGKVNREFRNSLREAYERNIEKNNSFVLCLQHLCEVLRRCNGEYAMLKGAYLCQYYPLGYRTCNDIDLLVLSEDVTEIGSTLLEAGFKQGNIRNGIFTSATRKETIESKMTRGETVPYIKEVQLPGMQYLEVDINFSLDYKNGDKDIVNTFLKRSEMRKNGDIEIQTLNECDFFIHLCSHLYKEATTFPWVEMKRDMTMYKYCDIYLLLSNMSERVINNIFERAEELKMDEMCAFAIVQTAELLGVNNVHATEAAITKLASDFGIIHQVISPKDKKVFSYTEKDVRERFFANNRKELLKEVKKI